MVHAQCLGTTYQVENQSSMLNKVISSAKYARCNRVTWMGIMGKSKRTAPETVTFFPVEPSQVFSNYSDLPIPEEQ